MTPANPVSSVKGGNVCWRVGGIYPLVAVGAFAASVRPRREGLVKTRRSSQYVHYSLDSAEVKAVIGILYEQFRMPCEEAAE